MLKDDANQQIRHLVGTYPLASDAVSRSRGSHLPVLRRPASTATPSVSGRGSTWYPGSPTPRQVPGMIHHLKAWPATYVFSVVVLLIGLIWQLLYA